MLKSDKAVGLIILCLIFKFHVSDRHPYIIYFAITDSSTYRRFPRLSCADRRHRVLIAEILLKQSPSMDWICTTPHLGRVNYQGEAGDG